MALAGPRSQRGGGPPLPVPWLSFFLSPREPPCPRLDTLRDVLVPRT